MKSELHGMVTDMPVPPAIDAVFAENVKNHANTIAIFGPDGELVTFKELDDLANKYAVKFHYKITKRCRGSSRTVLLAMSASVDRVACMLALFKLKLAYVPVEPCVPESRRRLMIRELKPVVILADKDQIEIFRQVAVYAEGVNILEHLDEFKEFEPDDLEPAEPVNGAGDTDACVLYTSGSTGPPKGVVLTHENILTRLNWQWRQFPFEEDEVGICKTSTLFVDSICEIWGFLLKGKPVHIMDETKRRDPRQYIQAVSKYKVTRLLVVPSALQALIGYSKFLETSSAQSSTPEKFPMQSLKKIVCSGETLPLKVAQEFFEYFGSRIPGIQLLDFYGSTEVTGDCTFAVITLHDVQAGMVPIGSPIDNVRVKIVDSNGDTVDENEIGEVLIGGKTIMKGYYGDSESSSNIVDGWYSMGDFGKLVVIDGRPRIVFEGRNDEQVKLRGHRISLLEIDHVLSEIVEVERRAVLLFGEDDNAQIVAFVTFLDKATETTALINKCKKHLEKSLAKYMLPRLEVLDEFPLMPAGKVDRQALRRRFYEKERNKSINSDSTEDELKFLKLVSKELGDVSCRMSDEFGYIGGNSINVLRLLQNLRDEGYSVDFDAFISSSTLQDMYSAVKGGQYKAKDIYEILPITEDDDYEFLVRLASDEFLERDVLVNETRMSKEEWFLLSYHMFQTGYKDGLGFKVVDRRNGKTIGTLLCFDADKFTTPDHIPSTPELDDFVELLLQCEEPFAKYMKPGEKLLDFFLSGFVTDGLSSSEKLELTYLTESYMLQMAKERGFDAVKECNSSPVTQAIAVELGYHTVNIVDEFYTKKNGEQPYLGRFHDGSIASQIYFIDGRELCVVEPAAQ